MTGTSTAGVLSQARIPASPSLRARTDAARQALNPLFEASRPLLQALADTPVEIDGDAVAERHMWLEHEVRMFSKTCAGLQLRTDQVQNARYCLCSAIDEAAMQTDWGKGMTTGVEWSSRSLAVAFGQDRQGADRVFHIIEAVMADPFGNLDLIDVIQNILDLGFQGRYRFEMDGQNKLIAVRERVHDAVLTRGSVEAKGIAQYTPPVSADAPVRLAARHARVLTAGRLRGCQVDPWVRAGAGPEAARKTRLWIVIGLLCAIGLCAASYAMYGKSIGQSTVAQRVPPIDALARNLNGRLASEIAAGTLRLEQNNQRTALTLRFSDMFPPGEAAINGWMKPLIATVGQEIAGTTGKVQVTGYTDSLPVGKSTLVSNKALSEARAKQVLQILLAAGVPADRLAIAGKADADPVADNETPQGRMMNRRVEIVVSE
jgi:type VI secretion system protein ImpK